MSSDKNLNVLQIVCTHYPSLRNYLLHSGHLWLESKRIDDGAEGLWRIHDSLYDFGGFVNLHPGGKDWLGLTKGTDITNAFESHHVSEDPQFLLPNYFKRRASKPRNSPYTFRDKGFYRTLKRSVCEELEKVSERSTTSSKCLIDLLLFTYVSLSIYAVYLRSFIIGALAGVALALMAACSHSFIHQKDNFRMHYFDFTMMSSRQWRVGHVLSHHLYPDIINNMDVAFMEQFLKFLPTPKPAFVRYSFWLCLSTISGLFFVCHFLKIQVQGALVKEYYSWEPVLAFTIPILTFLWTGESPIFCATMFMWTILISSTYFLFVRVHGADHIGVLDTKGEVRSKGEERDWGIFQLNAVMKMKNISGSHLLVTRHFSDHALHYLFPTIDPSVLKFLWPIFLETCEKFQFTLNVSSEKDD